MRSELVEALATALNAWPWLGLALLLTVHVVRWKWIDADPPPRWLRPWMILAEWWGRLVVRLRRRRARGSGSGPT